MNEVVLGKWLFPSIKQQLCLTKGHLDNEEGQVEDETLPQSEVVLTLLIHIKKKFFFFKKGSFNEASDPRALYLFKIGLRGHFEKS